MSILINYQSLSLLIRSTFLVSKQQRFFFWNVFVLLKKDFWKKLFVQGVQKKMRRRFCLISLAANMLEGWEIIHWKGGIDSFVWSTNTFLYDIWEPRYKQNKIGYHISKCLNIGQYKCLEIWCPILFYFDSAPLWFTEMGLNFQHPNRNVIFKMGYIPAL